MSRFCGFIYNLFFILDAATDIHMLTEHVLLIHITNLKELQISYYNQILQGVQKIQATMMFLNGWRTIDVKDKIKLQLLGKSPQLKLVPMKTLIIRLKICKLHLLRLNDPKPRED